MNITIRKAAQSDAKIIVNHDRWCPQKTIEDKISREEVFVAYDDEDDVKLPLGIPDQ